MYNVQTDI